MFEDLALSAESINGLKLYAAHSGQSLVLVGNRWMEKREIARRLIAALLDLPIDKLSSYPYLAEISSVDNKKIGIDEIRAAANLLSLKIASSKPISRIILLNEAELLTPESQNALLKDLEEPPEGTIFILTATSATALLPTIISRLQVIRLNPPDKSALYKYFEREGHSKKEIDTAFNMSGGQPGLMKLLLEDSEHPLNRATKLAKEVLQGSSLERLTLINDLAKDKTELNYFFYILKEMAKIGLKSSDSLVAKKWKRILSSALKSESMLSANTQTKLALTDFILSMS